MPEEKLQQFQRLLALTGRLLGSTGITVRELAGDDPAARRKTQRDLAKLRECGLPLETTEGEEAIPRYRISNLRLAGGHLDLEETLAFTLLAELAGENDIGKIARRGWDKLHYVVQNGEERKTRSTLPVMLSAQAGWNLPAPILKALSQGLVEQRRLRLLYRGLADAEARWRLVDPWQLFFQGRWYLRAWDPATQLAKTFHTERIQECQVTSEAFQLPASLRSADHHFHKWDLSDEEPTTVRCEIDEKLARWLQENAIHPSLKVDGLQFEVTVRDLAAFLRWTMSLSHCRILGPERALELYQERLQQLLQSCFRETR